MPDAVSAAAQKLTVPAGAVPRRVAWIDVSGLVFCHVLASLAFVPWFFSWTGVVLAFIGLYVFGTLGISLCFHRLLTHRGLVCPKPLEYAFAILGVCSLQDTPARWVAMHRRHHEHADKQSDPHSPLVHFLWAHMGWLIFKNRETLRLSICSRYAKDVLREPFYARLERKGPWLGVVALSWAAFFVSGFVASLILGGTVLQALQFGSSLLIWGVFVRTVVVWHSTWAVNSVAHTWGYRNYETDESSRNNVIVGFLSNGEGWHNNHHADPRSARHGHLWWEFDMTWLTIRLLESVGLARRVMVPSPHLLARARSGGRPGPAPSRDCDP